MLIGNKSDLTKQRAVSYAEGLQFAKENNIFFTECPAKTAENVDAAFRSTAEKIYEKIKNGDIIVSDDDVRII